jgi:hypothetical protein
MAAKVKTWVWIVVAIVVVGILGIVALAGLGFYFASQHIDTQPMTSAAAATEFDQIKAKFQAQQPLIELDERGDFKGANTTARPAAVEGRRPDQLHVVVFDPNDERVVRMTIPFWLLRLKTGNATIDLNGNRMDLEDMKLSIEDLERWGPTLILDHKGRDGERVLVWSQ